MLHYEIVSFPGTTRWGNPYLCLELRPIDLGSNSDAPQVRGTPKNGLHGWKSERIVSKITALFHSDAPPKQESWPFSTDS